MVNAMEPVENRIDTVRPNFAYQATVTVSDVQLHFSSTPADLLIPPSFSCCSWVTTLALHVVDRLTHHPSPFTPPFAFDSLREILSSYQVYLFFAYELCQTIVRLWYTVPSMCAMMCRSIHHWLIRSNTSWECQISDIHYDSIVLLSWWHSQSHTLTNHFLPTQIDSLEIWTISSQHWSEQSTVSVRNDEQLVARLWATMVGAVIVWCRRNTSEMWTRSHVVCVNATYKYLV